MEHIKIVQTKVERLINIGPFAFDINVFQELGEGVFYNEHDTFIYIRQNGVVVGFIGGYIKFGNNKIKYLYILPNKRAVGFGQLLLKHFEQLCTGEIKLVATKKAVAFYKRNGYTTTKVFKTCEYMYKK